MKPTEKGPLFHRHPGLDPGSRSIPKPLGAPKSGIPDRVRDDEGEWMTAPHPQTASMPPSHSTPRLHPRAQRIDLLRQLADPHLVDLFMQPHDFQLGAQVDLVIELFGQPVLRRLAVMAPHDARQIGRASCRERVCQYVSLSVVAVSLKKKNLTMRECPPKTQEQT